MTGRIGLAEEGKMEDGEKSYWRNESYRSYCPNIILSHDLTIGEAGYERCDPGHRWGPGTRNFWTFHYVESGKGILVIDGRTIRIRKDDFFVMGPDDYVMYQADEEDPWTYRWISFNGAKAPDIINHISIGPENPVVNIPGAECAALIEAIYEGVNESDYPQFFALGRLYLFIEWLLKTFPKENAMLSDRAQEYFYSIINYIEVHLCSELTIQGIAHDLGFDRTYIFKLFKKFTGKSPCFYIECLKVYKACQLIDQDKYSLQEVARRSGFFDYGWFCKVFRKCAGVAPNEYMKATDKAYIMNCYNLTFPRDVLANLERFSKHAW